MPIHFEKLQCEDLYLKVQNKSLLFMYKDIATQNNQLYYQHLNILYVEMKEPW
jgi:hypothetical protein